MEKSNFTFMLVEECKYNGRLAEYHNILHKLYAIPKENELRLPPFSIAIQGTYYNDEGPIEKNIVFLLSCGEKMKKKEEKLQQKA